MSGFDGLVPKENYKKMKLKTNDIRATLSPNRAFAFFPSGDTSIIECILRYVKEGAKRPGELVT